ncbi:hypothetical protein GbCGDNIH6_7226 [Granulibacter bethesdensis]|nr:hypothetical protein GbCGDNIH6_7226 [Granulibacter bethesdensis]
MPTLFHKGGETRSDTDGAASGGSVVTMAIPVSVMTRQHQAIQVTHTVAIAVPAVRLPLKPV